MQTREEKCQYNRMRYWRKRNAIRKKQKAYWKHNYQFFKQKKSDYQKSRLAETYSQRRGYALKHKYGITYSDYKKMLEEQKKCCAICRGKNKHWYALAVDHNHKTGKIRSLLCNSCNMILGYAKDNTDTLVSCIKYLEQEGKTNV